MKKLTLFLSILFLVTVSFLVGCSSGESTSDNAGSEENKNESNKVIKLGTTVQTSSGYPYSVALANYFDKEPMAKLKQK